MQDAMTAIKDILNRNLKGNIPFPIQSCELAIDKITLILYTAKEEDTCLLVDKINEISPLQNVIEVEYSREKRKKLIILGIPKTTEAYGRIWFRRKYKSFLGTHQLILDLSDNLANYLMSNRKILVVFNSCKVLNYKPVIRCNNCQASGHTIKRCIRRNICGYCTRIHETDTCPNKHKT